MSDKHNVPSDDRRRHERLNSTSTLLYRSLEDLTLEDQSHKADLCDFSGGGVRFMAGEQLAKNMQLILELEFPGWLSEKDNWTRTGKEDDSGQLKAIGAVMWCAENKEQPGKYEVGVRFTGRIR